MDALINLGVNLVKNYFNYGENFELLQKNFGELMRRADDIEEQVKMAESSGKNKRKRQVENWFEDINKLKDDFNTLQNKVNEKGRLKHPMIGEHVVKMLEQVAALIEQSRHFEGFVLDSHENKGEPRLTSRLFGRMFKDNFRKIQQCLLNNNIRSIGIYGMGGVGKTTLAKHINNHLLKIPDFRVCWLTVSQELSTRKLQDDIARYMDLRLSKDDDEEQRAVLLSRKLMQMKNFVLVLILDDVWEGFCLKKLGDPLRAGCKLILTTRFLEVCDKMFCHRKFEMNTLHAVEAWELFKDMLGYQKKLQKDVEMVAKKIVQKCGGLPLGIITMAGSMRGVNDVAEWRDALNKLEQLSSGHDDMEKEVFPVLQWSFNRLNKCHQRCLLCCSLYPGDYVISEKEIITRFISLDLMDKRDTRRQEYDQGHAILNKLINSCLLEKATDDEGIQGVKMHDLIRDMALRLTSGNSIYNHMHMPNYMVKSGVGLTVPPCEREWAKDLHVVSLMDNHISEISPDISPQCSNLSVLILQRNCYLKSIPDSFFDHFKTHLKVLDLSGTSIEELPKSISDMVNLNALILTYCRGLKVLPSLGKLKNLRELDLQQTSIDKIPVGLEALINLKYLNMKDVILLEVPQGTFSGLRYLQYLRINCPILGINELLRLQQLKIFEGRLFDVDSYNKLFISYHARGWFDYYYILVNPRRHPFQNGIYVRYGENIHCDGKELIFWSCNFENRGRGADVVLLPHDIETLEVRDCYGMSSCMADTILLNSSTCLSKLVISWLPVEFLLKLSTLGDNCSSLQALLELQIKHLPELIELVRWEDLGTFGNLSQGTFSCLRVFSIEYCDMITKLFPFWLLQNLQNLEEIHIIECYKLENVIAEDDDAGKPESTSSETIVVTLPRLKMLRLYDLPQLSSIYAGTLFCDSIEIIEIMHCPNLKRLPLYLPATVNGELSRPCALKYIWGSDRWWESLEWDNPRAKNVLQTKRVCRHHQNHYCYGKQLE